MRCGLFLFFRKIIFSDQSVLRREGALLLACNHPNSFLDAILLGAYFKSPVHFLARGDAFKKPLPNKLLTALNAIPIYRLSEGEEHLDMNAETFATCVSILQRGGIVLIFVEGLGMNEWRLRPLKKGGAHIALHTWHDLALHHKFRIVPVGFNYSNFTRLKQDCTHTFCPTRLL